MSLDRLTFTLIFSVAFHLAFLFGISFQTTSPPTNTSLINLDITLVHQQTEKAPEQADFLAQADNIGGGELSDKTPEPVPEELLKEILDHLPPPETTASVPPVPEPIIEPIMPDLLVPDLVVPEPVIPELVIPQPIIPKPVIPKPTTIKKPPASQDKLITQIEAERKVVEPDKTAEESKQDEIIPAIKPQFSATELISMARTEIERLESKYDATAEALSKTPKKRRISSSTKEYAAAAYHEAWRKKVERIGNMNYPQEAKRRQINGSLMLAVDINPDGSVPADGITVLNPSRHKMLNEAAIRIVRLGAPYSAVPADVLKDNDMITIIRTWKFETNQGLSSKK